MDLIEIVVYVFVYVFFMPILVITHELGHAIVALIASRNKVDVIIGDANLNLKLKINKLTIYFRGYKSFLGVSYGCAVCSIENNLSKILMYLGGPIVSLSISITLFFILIQFNEYMSFTANMFLNAIFNYSLGNFIITILPIKYNYYPYRGCKSDGYHVIKILKGEREIL